MITLNGHEVKATIFPDKTSQVWKLPDDVLIGVRKAHLADIIWSFESEAEIVHLAQLKTLINQLRHTTNIMAILHLPYLPYARQDKNVSNEATFGLTTFANLLNTLQFDEVHCLDPHSNVANELINKFKPYYPIKEVERAMLLVDSNLVCYPDKGAVSKYSKIYDYPYIYGEKVRDRATGNITSYKLVMEAKDARAAIRDHTFKNKYDINGKNTLIIDDIADGGATFCILAKQLYDAGAKSVSLFVSHGVFSKGKQVLYDAGIKYVLTPEDLDE